MGNPREDSTLGLQKQVALRTFSRESTAPTSAAINLKKMLT